MNILFIGGSNMVLTQGVSAKLPRMLALAGVPVGTVDNIAVGATGSLFGLENLTLHPQRDTDLVIIEYGINDLPTYSRDKALWEKGYSGLLGLARSRYPSAMIVSLLLGRRDEKFWHTQSRMHADMARLSARHGVHVFNFDAEFKSEKFKKTEFASLYIDESHFQEPLVTGYIAQQCALEVVGLMQARDAVQAAPAAGGDSTALLVTPVDGPGRCFSNSRFSRNTAVLAKDERIQVRVPGIPTGLSFVSVKESCSVRVDFAGHSKIVHTLNRFVHSERFKFIVKHVPLIGVWQPGMAIPAFTDVTLQAIDAGSDSWDPDLVQKTHSMIEPSPLAASVNLCAITSWIPGGSAHPLTSLQTDQAS